ncbi:MAG2-interacting protein 2 isoform X3 [Syzygium oleosum]|nr:MAG2-interacting protein 2 isoform X3 [Syzygium oleosum]XP_056175696.1 MAG2-interacting protein 2 isoform X3 [Syzygium oleosum]
MLDLEHLYSTEFKGVYSLPKGYQCHQSYPKVLISPRGTLAAALDVTGEMHIFRLDTRGLSLVNSSLAGRSEVQELLSGILDFTWWSDRVLTLSKRGGATTMIDVTNGLKVMDSDPAYSIPVLQRVQEVEGHLFLIETTPSENSAIKKYGSHIVEQITEYNFDQFDLSRLQWSLISFSEKSIQEMYRILIFNKKYEAAMEFAHRHGLDRDDVMKSRWLHSDQGKHAIKDFLIMIADQDFVLAQCVEKVGSTEDAAKSLLEHGLRLTNQYVFSKSEDGNRAIWDRRMARLQLLQYMDRLETYMGINMGRFSMQEYFKFRDMPLNDAAVKLAESGKIGALNLLFKRHPYSLIPFMLEILAAIPETVPVQTYRQLLPGSRPPANIVLREEDWVECEKMVNFIQKLPMDDETAIKFKTEPIVKRCLACCWLPTDEILSWYKKRAVDIDSFSGQLDNCLCLVDVGRSTGINALQHFYENISYLNQLMYTDGVDGDLNISLSLVAWEDLSDYEKFKMMLRGVKVETVIERLHNKAMSFMQNRLHGAALFSEDKVESFLVRWLREIASENKLDLCLVVIDEGCRDFGHNGFFKDEVEAVDSTLQCIYRCSSTDQWSNMVTILSKLPQVQGNADLEGRLKLAEAHIEAGRILAFYQVPKPISFFLEAHSDEKVVKQIFRLILSKFVRRQAGQSDNDWASMWRDMQSLREKAFTFLDAEYMLIEFCKGLLKAGKFSLARNYLKGTSTVALAPEKAENLVIQAAREYFFSASTLASTEIWKAKECLNLFPGSSAVKAENDIIVALTTKLPRFGVTLLPVQFRQIKDPMEIIKMVITSQPGAYLDVDEIIEVSKLLGLRSKDDISAVEEAVAREAAVAGDLQLAFDLCLVLVKKGHGFVWDLCAAIARGPGLENMDVNSRKLLLGFALSNCDEESISELLHAWKDLDMQGQCETLMTLTGTGPNFSVKSALVNSDPVEQTEEASSLTAGVVPINGSTTDNRVGHLSTTEDIILSIARDLPLETGSMWDSLILENERISSFAASELPWLIQLSRTVGSSKKLNSGLIFGENYVNVRAYAVVTILSWLAKMGFAPRDYLIVSLAKSVIESQATEWEDILGCSVLLNLVDAFNGVEVIEEELRRRRNYQEICSIMNVGMKYGLLHNSGVECEDFNRRRELLLRFFKEKHMPVSSDEMEKFGNVQSTFWREWKLKLEERKHVADHSRVLEQIIPGVDTARFLSGDTDYIESVVFSLIESVKMERKHILKDLLKLANTYSLNRSEVLLRFLSSVLVSDIWTNDDITAEIAEVRGEIVGYGQRTVETISMMVYPAIDGHKKHRLAFLYSLVSDCCMQLDEKKESLPLMDPDQTIITSSGLARFYKVIEQECRNISFVKDLNFKNIVGLDGLNLECFRDEVYRNIDEHCVEALANMVKALVSLYAGIPPEGLISWQDVYKQYILSLLMPLVGNERTNFTVERPETYQGFIGQVEHKYEMCRKYIKLLTDSDIYEIMKRFFIVSVPNTAIPGSLLDSSAWQECLILLMNFFIRLTEDIQEVSCHERSREILRFNPTCFMKCLKSFTRLVIEDSVSPSQGWGTIVGCINSELMGGVAAESSIFCRAMIFSGCGFGVVSEVFSEAASQCSSSLEDDKEMQGLPALYLTILEPILRGLGSEVPDYQNLCSLLSSLSKLEGDMENQKGVRRVVWERMANYSNDLRLPGHGRVYALELMQSIVGRPIKSAFTEQQLNVLPWEGWDELHDTGERRVTSPSQGVSDYSDTSNRFTSTLVALRSSQIMAPICPSLEITPDDLLDIGTVVSCFSKLCGAADTDSYLKALVTVLGEWEGLFVVGKDDKNSAEVTDAGNDWDNDDWNEGWESFQEVEPLNTESKGSSSSLHPLHVCWSELIQRHVALSLFGDVLRFLDLSLSKPNGILLDEDNARSLCKMMLGRDFLWAFKMMMLLPYGDLHLNCLDAVEEKLKQEGMTDEIGKDLDVLILVLYSGFISKIISGSLYDSSFTYICYLVGHFSRQCQEACLLRLAHKETSSSEDERPSLIVFERILLPAFICELVKADEKMLAGFVVTKYMHTNASLSLINIAEAGLQRYLEGQLNKLHHEDLDLETTIPCLVLKHAVSSLLGRLVDLIPSALSLLSAR